MKKVLFASGAGITGAGGPGVPVRNGLVAEYKFDECRNLLKYSQRFDNQDWGNSRAIVSANAAIAPDGTTTADKIVETALDGAHAIYKSSFPMPEVSAATFSVYGKKGERNRINLYFRTAAGYMNTIFDLSGGTIVSVGAGITASMQPCGNGWYRCTVSGDPLGGTAGSWGYVTIRLDDNTESYLGDITKGLYLWGAQLEVGSAATTYVPTTDKQTLMDYSKPRKNLLLPNQANCCEDGVATWFTKATAGDTVSASITVAWQGTYSAKVICANAAASEGLYTTNIIYSLNPSSPYTASAYVYGSVAAETVKIGIEELTDPGVSVGVTYANLTLGASWQRVEVTRTFGATGRAARIYVITQSKQACTMYVDGLQLEEGSTATAWEAPPNIGILGSAIGTTTNDPTWTGDGQYLTTDDYNILPQSPFALSQYTLCVVWNPDAADTADVLLAKNSGTATAAGGTGFILAQTATGTGDLTLSQFDSDAGVGTLHTVSSATTPAAATWHFSAAACDGTKLYLSPGQAAAYTAGGTTLTTAAPDIVKSLHVGRYAHDASGYYAGSIAYIAIYNRKLAQAEITRNYAYLKSYLKKQRGISLA
jgi:hypothetical protein